MAALPETSLVAVFDAAEGYAGHRREALAQGSVVVADRNDEAPGYIDLSNHKEHQRRATSRALCAALEARDLGTGQHLHRVTRLATSCMRLIDEPLAVSDEVVYGFMLHDVGKIGVPDDILLKPGPLDYWEFEVIRAHPQLGIRIAEPGGFSQTTLEVILNHHERWDGLGYPGGMRGQEIPLPARVFAVADAYDAMTSDRPYRLAMPPRDALQIIRSSSGHAFDPDVVEVFEKLLLSRRG